MSINLLAANKQGQGGEYRHALWAHPSIMLSATLVSPLSFYASARTCILRQRPLPDTFLWNISMKISPNISRPSQARATVYKLKA